MSDARLYYVVVEGGNGFNAPEGIHVVAPTHVEALRKGIEALKERAETKKGNDRYVVRLIGDIII